MLDYQQDVVDVLTWAVVTVGAILVALVVYTWKRLDNKVEALPGKIVQQITKVHDEIEGQLTVMNDLHKALEIDLRFKGIDLDRRVTRLESFYEWQRNAGGRGHDETT